MAVHSSSALQIRRATASDTPVILSFVRKLADYERLSHEVTATEDRLRDALFGDHRFAEVVLAYMGADPVGFAVYFYTFSTYLAQPGIYLEDLFVEPAHRRRGVGKALLAYLAKLTKERGCARLEWSVLDWNEQAIDFYRGLGAALMNEWLICRLTGEALDRAAAGSPS